MNIPGLNSRKLNNILSKPSKTAVEVVSHSDSIFHRATQFHHMLRIERKRISRSKKPFLLTLVDISAIESGKHHGYMIEKMKEILISCTRETDIMGWYENNRIMGIIFTEMACVDRKSIEKITRKIRKKIDDNLNAELANKIVISPHVFGLLEDNKD